MNFITWMLSNDETITQYLIWKHKAEFIAYLNKRELCWSATLSQSRVFLGLGGNPEVKKIDLQFKNWGKGRLKSDERKLRRINSCNRKFSLKPRGLKKKQADEEQEETLFHTLYIFKNNCFSDWLSIISRTITFSHRPRWKVWWDKFSC